jgi:hypothetical protein
MTTTLKSLLILLIYLPHVASAETLSLRIIGEQSAEDASQVYFEVLFKKALKIALKEKNPGSDPEVEILELPYSDALHGGVERILEKGDIDFFWSATDTDMEKRLLPVRIPLVMGLLGYRVSITHKDNLNKLASIENLRSLKSCQLRHWNDVRILDFNGFSVVPTNEFAKTFELTQLKRCDYFPRAIYEGYEELRAAQKRFPELVMFDDILMYYPYPLYVFTSRSKKELNQLFQTGLKRMVYSGELLEHIKNSEITRHLFPLSQWQNKQIINLENPLLPAATPLDDERLWLSIN